MLTRALSRAAGSSVLERLVTQNPILSKPAHRFIAGEQLQEAVAAAIDLQALGISALLDLVGEGVTDAAGATEATAEYLAALEAIAESGLDGEISVKLTQLGQSVDRAACQDNLNQILSRSSELGVPVEIDMEDHTLVSDTLVLFRHAVARNPSTRVAMQAMLRRTSSDFHALADITPRVRLVKGAYDEPIDAAERDRRGVNAQFKLFTDWLMVNGGDPAFGTHDSALIDYVRAAAQREGKGKGDFEIQMLYGVRRDLQEQLAREGYRVRIYIPYGSAWYPYFVRRLAERPANLSFFVRALVGR
ncbi:proline dehydrogenase family protein [Dermatophilaceae bacterium Soc4.6]